jgi:hypothetical protein
VTLIVIFTAITSLGFSTRAQAPLGTVHEHPSGVATTVAVAAVVAGFAAYGWVADKFYDLGKEIGRSEALEEADGGLGSRQYLDHRYEILLD